MARDFARSSGGSTFAEDPSIAAPDARLIWRANLDPSTLSVSAVPVGGSDPDRVDARDLAPWLALVSDIVGQEFAVLSDGLHHLRLDVDCGSLCAGTPVVLHYRLFGTDSLTPKLMPLRRLVDLVRHHRFAPHLYPADPRIDRWLLSLRVLDAINDSASQREIATALFGARVSTGWEGAADSLRSRVRRLARETRVLAQGGYRFMMRTRRGVPGSD